MSKKPSGNLSIKALAMPADTNENGDIFGGWLMSQMDLAASVTAKQTAKTRVVTVAIDAMVFHLPVYVGDLICCYCDMIKIGRTSMRIKVEAWVIDHVSCEMKQVTEGMFTFVAIDENRKPIPVKR